MYAEHQLKVVVPYLVIGLVKASLNFGGTENLICNVALKKHTYDMYENPMSCKGVDGLGDAESCVHVPSSDAQEAWWQVDLGGFYMIESIHIKYWSLEAEFIKNVMITFNDMKCTSYSDLPVSDIDSTVVVSCDELVEGKVMKIQKTNMDTLIFCEVEVYAYSLSCPRDSLQWYCGDQNFDDGATTPLLTTSQQSTESAAISGSAEDSSTPSDGNNRATESQTNVQTHGQASSTDGSTGNNHIQGQTSSSTQGTTEQPISTSGLITDGGHSTTGTGCSCNCQATSLSNEEIAKIKENMKHVIDEIKTDKKKTSYALRKLISVPDYRYTASRMGYAGAAVILSVIGLIVLIDLSNLLQCIKK